MKLTKSKLKEIVKEEIKSLNEAKKKVPIEKLSVGNTYTDSKGYPVKVVDVSGSGNSWKVTYKDGYGKKRTIKTSLSKGVNLYESLNERRLDSKVKKAILIAIEMSGDMTGAADKIEKIKKGLSSNKKVKAALRLANESINEAGMFDDYHNLNRAYMDNFIKNYKKLNRKNVVKKKGDDIYGFRKGEREAHWKYDDSYKLHYDIDKSKALGLINNFNRFKKNHPWG